MTGPWASRAKIYVLLAKLRLNYQMLKEKLPLQLKSKAKKMLRLMPMLRLMLRLKMKTPIRSAIQHQSKLSALRVNLLLKTTLILSNIIKTPKNRKSRNLSLILVRSLLKMDQQSLKAVLMYYMRELLMELYRYTMT